MRICVIIPTYNNSGTIANVISSALEYCPDVIVVSDGADAQTVQEIRKFDGRIQFVGYDVNRGKGYALKQGFRKAIEAGFDYAITIDSDGQHFADDIPAFKEAIEACPGALFIGSRRFGVDNMPSGNTFANKFSNFWFKVQTGMSLADTQTGYRAYPLSRCIMPLSNRYEAELEMLVRTAWRGTPIVPIPIKVYYAPVGERVSHFRKGKDFFRISVLNTVLTIVSIIYGWPSILIHRIARRK